MKLDPALRKNIEGKMQALSGDLKKLDRTRAEIEGALKGFALMLHEDDEARKPKGKAKP